MNFYLHKHLSQWADGTYASRQATLATYGGRSDFLKEVYEGSLASAYIEWGNAWQNVLYLGMLLFCIATVRKRRPGNGSANAAANDDFRFRNICLYTYTGLIAVLGGFLFHTIWEANSRYIFVYSLLLMPYCAAGIHTGSEYSDCMVAEKTSEPPSRLIANADNLYRRKLPRVEWRNIPSGSRSLRLYLNLKICK